MMKHCPNPACSHLRAVGSAAEYVDDRATCSDCGATLEDGPMPERPDAWAPIPASLWGRLALTIAAIPVVLLLQRIPLPGIDIDAFAQFAPGSKRSSGAIANISVVALGIMPLLSAAVLVQITALIVPPWRALRWSPAGRARLYKAMLITTLVLCIFQGFGVTRLIQSLSMVGDIKQLVVWPTLVAGTFLLVGMAAFLSRYSLGNGIAVLLAAWFAPPMLTQLVEQLTADDGGTPAQRVLVVVLPAMLAGITLYTLTRHPRAPEIRSNEVDAEAAHRYREAPEHALSPRIRVPSSGIIPITLVASLLALVGTLGSLGLPTSGLYFFLLNLDHFLQIPLAMGIAALFAFLFHPLPNLVEHWSRGLKRRDDRDHVREELRQERRRAALRSAAFIGGLMLMGSLGQWSGSSLGPLTMGILTAISMDFLAEWRTRRAEGDLATVWSEDDVGAADAVMSTLAAEHIPVHARGIHLRTLLQIMGPYVPIELMVPAARMRDAAALLRKRFPEASPAPDREPL